MGLLLSPILCRCGSDVGDRTCNAYFKVSLKYVFIFIRGLITLSFDSRVSMTKLFVFNLISHF